MSWETMFMFSSSAGVIHVDCKSPDVTKLSALAAVSWQGCALGGHGVWAACSLRSAWSESAHKLCSFSCLSRSAFVFIHC